MAVLVHAVHSHLLGGHENTCALLFFRKYVLMLPACPLIFLSCCLCRDGFMVGGLAVCLRFCRPFLEKADKKQGALQVGYVRRAALPRCSPGAVARPDTCMHALHCLK